MQHLLAIRNGLIPLISQISAKLSRARMDQLCGIELKFEQEICLALK